MQSFARHLTSTACLALLAASASAQDLVITNARLLDGAGRDIANGSVVIRDGRIASVASGAADAGGVDTIDARGMTLMPGYIDAHRHIIRGDSDQWFREQSVDRMREFLESGFTTLMSGGGPVPGIIELKQRIDSNELEGPRIITSGRADPRSYSTPAAARERVRAIAAAGVEIIKVRIEVAPTEVERAVLAAVVDEGRRHGLDVMVHASSVEAMLTAVELGAAKLVHTPHGSFMSEADARAVAEAGIENLSTVGFGVPVFGVYNDDNVPTFRDGNPWPEGILAGQGRGREAGEKIVNGRTLFDAGVTYGFGTDTNYHPRDGLYHELKTLNLMFSPLDILEIMGPGTAAFIEMGDDLGTLDPGKIADLVLIDGDPLELIFNLLNVQVVIQGGEIVADKR
ncbi:MAG TPA: amidohydrolase family protein [Gammaproteobacteria bacterium]